MRWQKQSLVEVPLGIGSWAKSHAMLPYPIVHDDFIRTYVSFCDDGFVGRTGYMDISREEFPRVIDYSAKPLIDIGEPGAFDENGAVECSVLKVSDDIYYCYYVGFQFAEDVRYKLFTGLAISEDGGNSFKKYSDKPILPAVDGEEYFRCGPYVMLDEGRFKMWYIAGNSWIESAGKERPVYIVKYLESEDGIDWGDSAGEVCIDIGDPSKEHGFGRPWVLKEDGIYKMYYSIRAMDLGYRLGYAESDDCSNWQRKDYELGLEVSEQGWDSQMMCFSAVFELDGKKYMFYNGNNFGEDGFGYAELR